MWASSTGQYEIVDRSLVQHNLQVHSVPVIGKVVDALLPRRPRLHVVIREVLRKVLEVLVLEVRNGA